MRQSPDILTAARSPSTPSRDLSRILDYLTPCVVLDDLRQAYECQQTTSPVSFAAYYFLAANSSCNVDDLELMLQQVLLYCSLVESAASTSEMIFAGFVSDEMEPVLENLL